MSDARFKSVEINFVATIKESFAFTIKNITHVLKNQWVYFALIFLISNMPEHLGSKPVASLGEADGIGQAGISFLYQFILMILRYTLDILYIKTLYEWLAYGGDLKPFYLWPVSKNVWSRMILDLKVTCATSLPILAALVIAIPFAISAANGSIGLSMGVFILLSLISIPMSFYWGAIFAFANPIIYETKRVSLTKDFWRATKGNRAKLLGWNLVLMLIFIVLAGIVMAQMPSATLDGSEALKNKIQSLLSFSAPIMAVLTLFTSIFGTYFVVTIWKKLRVNVPQLNEPTPP